MIREKDIEKREGNFKEKIGEKGKEKEDSGGVGRGRIYLGETLLGLI